ncbi:hypothetical protein GCM10012278_33750 [Nonomuraea glycinis]|uniref:Uncharacterized protein n=1 Tax=Nonomuraea glycinis TaxID=2047744 RepID=A0A918E4P3_9ACTN|nr:hypothetical protein GCM10012278_33750 [Nonomuraea glycinis]
MFCADITVPQVGRLKACKPYHFLGPMIERYGLRGFGRIVASRSFDASTKRIKARP